MIGALLLLQPTHLLLCLLAGVWALANGMGVMVSSCSDYHHTPGSSRRRVLKVRVSVVSVAVVLTAVAVLLQVHHTGIYLWPHQSTLPHHLSTLSQTMNHKGVWVVTATSVAGTAAALVSLAATFIPCHNIDEDSSLNQVSMLSSGWVYEPSPLLPRISETENARKRKVPSMQILDLIPENGRSGEAASASTLSHSQLRAQDSSSSDDSGSYCETWRQPFYRENVSGSMVHLLSFQPRAASGGETSKTHQEYVNNSHTSPLSYTQLFRLRQSDSWSSPSGSRMGRDEATANQEQYLTPLSPIPRIVITSPIPSQHSISTNGLTPKLTSSTPEDASRSSHHSAPEKSLPERYSQSETLPYFSTDFREPFPQTFNVSKSSWFENINIIYHEVQSPLRPLHGSPFQDETILETPEQKQPASNALTSAYPSSFKDISVSSVPKRHDVNNRHPSHKYNQFLPEDIILTQCPNFRVPQLPLTNFSNESSTPSNNQVFTCFGQTASVSYTADSCVKLNSPRISTTDSSSKPTIVRNNTEASCSTDNGTTGQELCIRPHLNITP